MIRIGLVAAVLLATPAIAQSDAELFAKAKGIHDRAIVIDTHVDIPFDFGPPAYDMMLPAPGQQVHIPTMIEGGLDVPFLIVYMGQGERTVAGHAKAAADAFTKFAAIRRVTDQLNKDRLELALSAADVRRIIAGGKKAVVIGMENGYSMGTDLRLLDVFHAHGARYLGLLHNGHNELGDSAQPNRAQNEPDAEHNGLSPLGRQVVARLNELGIMADVSHASMKTTLDILALSRTPVIASHSGVKGINDHPRNMSDEALDALKRNGGVIQIVALDAFVRRVPPEKTQAIAALRKTMGMQGTSTSQLSPGQLQAYESEMAKIESKWPKAKVSDHVDHIDYAVKRIGIDHVGIASDFNGGGGIIGWNNAAETINVTVELVRRGYTEEHISKILGGNLLRVMEQVEAYANKQARGRR